MELYSQEEIDFIDNLLSRASTGHFKYSRLETGKFNFDLYNKLINHINKPPHHLVDSDGENVTLTAFGREVLLIGFKKYLDNLNKEKVTESQIKQLTLEDLQKTDSRSKNALYVAILAIVVSVIFGILQITHSDKTTDSIKKDSTNTQPKCDTTSKVNHSQLPSDSINKTSVKIISNSSKHN